MNDRFQIQINQSHAPTTRTFLIKRSLLSVYDEKIFQKNLLKSNTCKINHSKNEDTKQRIIKLLQQFYFQQINQLKQIKSSPLKKTIYQNSQVELILEYYMDTHIQSPFQNDSKQLNASRIDNSLNTDEFYQIHKSDVHKAQEQSEEAKKELVKQTKTPEESSDKNESNPSQNNQNNENQDQSKEEQKPNNINNGNKNNNIFYFIGINSILLNIFQFKLFKNLIFFLIYIVVMTFVNIFTYCYLFKRKETVQKLTQAKEQLLKYFTYLKNLNYRGINWNQFRNERVYIIICVVIIVILAVLSITSFARTSMALNKIREQESVIQNYKFSMNSLKHQYDQKIENLINQMSKLEKKIDQLVPGRRY